MQPGSPTTGTFAESEAVPRSVAIMQPYAFPYLGYFSLVEACDAFVFLDDVNFIPRGWINRNRILIDGTPYRFVIPLAGASQNLAITEIRLSGFAAFRTRFLRQLAHAYARAPHFESGIAYVEAVLATETVHIADLAIRSIKEFYRATGESRTFHRASEAFADTRSLRGAERLIGIAQHVGARRYVNLPGGTGLYDPAKFASQSVELRFVRSDLPPYPQVRVTSFIPALSIIDVLMHNSRPEAAAMARAFALH